MVGDAVVLDHRAVAVGAAVQALTVAIGRVRGAVDAGQGHAVGELPGWAENDDLLIDSGRVPVHIGPSPYRDPRQPASKKVTGYHAHTGWFHLDFGDGAEADEVFEHTGEGGEIVHGADGGAMRVWTQLQRVV